MKLFWKLFCSMVLITALACSAGGYARIHAQFRASLDREVAALYEENDLLRFALAQELAFNPLYSREELAKAAGGISITTGQGRTVSFRLSDEAGTGSGAGSLTPWPTGGFTATPPAPWPWRTASSTWKTAGRWESCSNPGRSSTGASSP